MHALQNQVLVYGDPFRSVLRRCSPGEEYNAVGSYLDHGVNHFLREELPALAGVRVGLALADCQTRVQE